MRNHSKTEQTILRVGRQTLHSAEVAVERGDRVRQLTLHGVDVAHRFAELTRHHVRLGVVVELQLVEPVRRLAVPLRRACGSRRATGNRAAAHAAHRRADLVFGFELRPEHAQTRDALPKLLQLARDVGEILLHRRSIDDELADEIDQIVELVDLHAHVLARLVAPRRRRRGLARLTRRRRRRPRLARLRDRPVSGVRNMPESRAAPFAGLAVERRERAGVAGRHAARAVDPAAAAAVRGERLQDDGESRVQRLNRACGARRDRLHR